MFRHANTWWMTEIWIYVGVPLEEGTVSGAAKKKKERDVRALLNFHLYRFGPYDSQAQKNLSEADWKYFKKLRKNASDAIWYPRKKEGDNDEASVDASLQKLRRFMNFFKWALIPRQKKTVFEENEKNLSDYNILQNFGYSSHECGRIRTIVDTRLEAKKG